ncbi:hypothetical protein AVEN_45242-1 [Araneus ventricosus]|uniref:Uncharacterized protein n=1 Tax=Araneus ventricosus TaxID=182803 RepID=A0A4Y2NF40_ARAVE|nr:hypothetical protein AVEN_45242-1 [Araneus ventricosus]
MAGAENGEKPFSQQNSFKPTNVDAVELNDATHPKELALSNWDLNLDGALHNSEPTRIGRQTNNLHLGFTSAYKIAGSTPPNEVLSGTQVGGRRKEEVWSSGLPKFVSAPEFY